jgi:hypothetical protein
MYFSLVEQRQSHIGIQRCGKEGSNGYAIEKRSSTARLIERKSLKNIIVLVVTK